MCEVTLVRDSGALVNLSMGLSWFMCLSQGLSAPGGASSCPEGGLEPPELPALVRLLLRRSPTGPAPPAFLPLSLLPSPTSPPPSPLLPSFLPGSSLLSSQPTHPPAHPATPATRPFPPSLRTQLKHFLGVAVPVTNSLSARQPSSQDLIGHHL